MEYYLARREYRAILAGEKGNWRQLDTLLYNKGLLVASVKLPDVCHVLIGGEGEPVTDRIKQMFDALQQQVRARLSILAKQG